MAGGDRNRGPGKQRKLEITSLQSEQAMFQKLICALLLGIMTCFYIEEHYNLWLGPRLAIKPVI